MAEPLRSAAPIGGIGSIAGFGGRPTTRHPDPGARPRSDNGSEALPAVTAEACCGGVGVPRRLLRERVLARTRSELELHDEAPGPAFAEVVDDETTTAFVGRLLSAQNQLAAHRRRQWEASRVRGGIDRGWRLGFDETRELLVADHRQHADALATLAEVLVEYERRAQAAADELAGDAPADSPDERAL